MVADPTRSVLYTLSENNWISVWKPEANRTLRKLQTLSNLQKQAQDRAPGAAALATTLKLLSLHVVDPRESKAGIQLIALSSNGVRLYFSPVHTGYGGYGYGTSYGTSYGATEPKQLQVVHVRLPPMNLLHPDEQFAPQQQRTGITSFLPPNGTQQQSPPFIVKNLTTASYVDGLMVAAQPSDVDGKDFILAISPDLTRIGSLGQAQAPNTSQAPSYYATGSAPRPPLTEQATLLYVEGTIWAIAPAVRPTISQLSSTPAASPEPFLTNELATQFSQPHREFIIVTNVGISHLVKRRALDYLRDALEEVQAEGSLQPIIDFRDSFGRDQSCAMLLGLASGNTFMSAERSGYSVFDEVVNVSPETAALAKQMFYDIGDRPILVDRGYGGGDGQGNILFSGRREGLALYFARLVRPLWRSKVTKVE